MNCKLSFLTLLLCLVSFHLSAQDKLNDVPMELQTFRWLDNTPYQIAGYEITMLSGETFTRYRNQETGEYTTMMYQGLEQILDSLNAKAEREQWPEERLRQKAAWYAENAEGGRIMFFISRYDESEANTRWYFVILRNEKDEKLLERDLEYQAPEVPEGIGWWNYYEFLIDRPVEFPLYVFLNNKNSQFLTDFRYEIKPLERPLNTRKK
jgi:hypothetical protein